MSIKPKVYFRADGNSKIGLGHVIRSLAVAEMINVSFECHFIIRKPSYLVEKQILGVCKSIVKLREEESNEGELLNILKEVNSGEIIVLDGYNFDSNYQKGFKKVGLKVVCIDDVNLSPFFADVVINHSGGLDVSSFSVQSYTKLFLGLKYALLRKPFRDTAKKKEQTKREAGNVFICLGGADPNNDLLGVLRKCEEFDFIKKCYVVLGSAFSHKMEFESFKAKTSLNVEVLNNISAEEMVAAMKICPIAITPPSSVSYEYLSVGGTLFLMQIADNQSVMYSYFISNNLALPFEQFGERSARKHNEEKPFDGCQGERILSIFKGL